MPALTRDASSRFVAATIRTSTAIGTVPPTRRNVRSSTARRNFACAAGGSSPISSRKSVPPSASSKRPARRSLAPVYAPRSCPKSSFSTRLSGRAATFTATNGPGARGERACTARAKSSLPVPDSPVRRTVTSEAAAGRIRSSASASAWDVPTISGIPARPASAARSECATADAPRAHVPRDEEEEEVRVDRLAQEVGRAQLHRGDRGLDGAESGQDDDGEGGVGRRRPPRGRRGRRRPAS